MRKYLATTLAAVVAAFVADPAAADSFGLHLVSDHFGSKKPKNNDNWGIYYRGDSGLTAGIYCNSYSKPGVYKGASNCDTTKYVGKAWLTEFTGPFGVSGDYGGALALAHGYGERLALARVGGAHLTVIPLPTLRYGHLRLSGIGHKGIHAQLEFKL